MDVRDTPTVVVLKGVDLTIPMRNCDAKILVLILEQAGEKEEDIAFRFPGKES